MQLHDLVFRTRRRRPDDTALILGADALSYDELCDGITSMARALSARGVRAGDRVAIYLNKRFEAVIAYFGASLAGAVFVPVNPGLKAAQVLHILNDCDASVLITTRSQAQALGEALNDCPALRCVVTTDAVADDRPMQADWLGWAHLQQEAGERPWQPVRRIDADMAAILYTSGSTGKPKGVVLSHRNMVAGALSVAEYLENSPDDRILAALPFSFDAGFSQLTTAFSVGASVVLLDYLLPRDVIRSVCKHQITGLAGVPPLWAQLVRQEWPEDARTSLRYFTNTGGAMPTATLKQLRASLPKTRAYLMYGLTEAFRSTYLDPAQIDTRPTSIGKAIPNAEILVVRKDGSRCDPNEPGELVHRGALVAMGYWNDPEKTARRFRPAPGQPDGLPLPEIAVWSGDTVVADDDGYLYFVGRSDDMIKSSGYRISPTELEELVFGTGLVAECAAIGLPHDDLGQAVVVVCHAENGGDETSEALLGKCRRELPNYMVPACVIWRDELPRNANGKIDRKALVEQYRNMYAEE